MILNLIKLTEKINRINYLTTSLNNINAFIEKYKPDCFQPHVFSLEGGEFKIYSEWDIERLKEIKTKYENELKKYENLEINFLELTD